MTIGIENTAHNDNTTSTGASSTTIAGFTVTNANGLCVVISFLTIGGTPPTSVTATWDSGGTNQVMTQVAHATGTGLDAYIFGRLAPTTGSHTLSVTWTNNANFGIGMVGLTGVTQASVAAAFVNATTNTGTGTTASVTVPTSANSGVIGIAVDSDPTSAASGVSNTVLLLGNGVTTNNAGDFVSNYQVPSNSTSVTLSYTLGSSNWVYAGINVLSPVKLEWGFEQYNQFQSPYSTVKNTHRAGGIKGKSGFAVSPIPFREGWQVQPPQPPFQPPIRQRSAAFSHPEEGVERQYINFHPAGWEIQPPQPPVNPRFNKKGSILKGIDGTEGRFNRFFPSGWEIQPPQPPTRPTSQQKSIGAVSHPEEGIERQYIRIVVGWEIQPWQPPVFPTNQQKYSGIKGKTTAATFSNWVNGGWEIQSVQPPNFLKTNQKIGALSQWEDGIERPYIFISATPAVWAFDFQQATLTQRFHPAGKTVPNSGDDGIESPYVNFHPSSWEIQPPSPPHAFIEKRGAILKGDDGNQGVLTRFFPSGWEIQPPQPPFSPRINQKYGALSHPEEGIEAKYVLVTTTQITWGFDFQQSPLKVNYRSGSWSQWEDGVEGQYNNFNPTGWEIQPPQPPVQPTTRQKAIEVLSHPEEGIEGQFQVVATLNWGFELQSGWQPPSWPKTNQKLAALSWWEDGIEAGFVFNAPPPIIWGYDIQSEQLRSFPTNQQKYSGARGKSGFGFFQPWFNGGWEIQPWQPPTFPKINQKISALSQWEDGIEAKFVFVAPTQIGWGYDIQPSHLLPRYLPNARSVPNSGDDGIQAQYISFHPSGWEVQPPQPPVFPKINQKIGALSQWEDGIEAKFIFVAPVLIRWGYDFQQPPLKVNYRSGATSQWEDGIELPYVFVPPTLTPRGWDVQPFQPSFYPTINQRGPAIKGKSEFAIYSPAVNAGWEIQPPQPPYCPGTRQKYGALSHPEEGIEGKFIFVSPLQPRWGWELIPHLKQVTSNKHFGIEGSSEFASFTFQRYGWEIQPYQPSLSLKGNQKIGSLSQWEDGIEAPYAFVSPVVPTINVDFQQPSLKINYRSSAWSQWEDGIEFTLGNFYPSGWEIQPPQPPTYPKFSQKIGALSQWEDGIEGKFVFVAPPAPTTWGYDIQPIVPKIFYRSGAWSQKTEGIDAPFINLHPYGWEVQPVQPPAFPKINIKYGALSHPEEGIEGKFTFVAPAFFTTAWEIQSFQPPHNFIEKKGAILRGDDGIEFRLINFFPAGWEIQPPQPPNFLKINLKYGALSHPEEGIEGAFIPPPSATFNWGFEFQTSWQPPYWVKTNQKLDALSQWEDGIELPLINFFPAGRETQPVQPPAYPKIRQKYGAISQPIVGTEGKFIFVPPPQPKWGWESPVQPRSTVSNRHFGIEGSSDFASFTYQPGGWEIQPYQPPAFPSIKLKTGALSHAESGVEGKFIFVAPAQPIWGYDIQPTISKINYRSGSWSQWEDGIEAPFNAFFRSGWEIQPPQPPHPKPEVKAAAVLKGIDSIEYPLTLFFRSGWEIQPPQPPFSPRINQKYGALSHPEEGIEAKYVFIAPPFFTNAWEIQPFQPRHTFVERRGVILKGLDGIDGKLTRFLPSGWEIQPPPPPFFLKTRQKIGATSQWEDGIEAQFVFVPPPPVFWAWEAQPAQLRYWATTHQLWGALSQWEDGVEGVYVFVPPVPPTPPLPAVVLGPVSGLRYQDMQVLGLSPTSNLYWDYGNTEDFYVLQNNILYRVSPKSAFNWYSLTPNAVTIYNPFLTRILSGESFDLSDDSN